MKVLAPDINGLKQILRRKGYDRRAAQRDPAEASEAICRRFTNQPEYQRANVVMGYIHCRTEVRTRLAIERALTDAKTLVVPYCTKDAEGHNTLGLWRLEGLEELVPGTWDILEPPLERRQEPDKAIVPEQLDLVMVPGVAFDREGGRLGNGAGYYDRLLARVRPDAALMAVGYEAQMFSQIPMAPYDVYMDKVITERAIYQRSGP